MVELGSPGYASNGVNEWRASAMTRVQVHDQPNVAVRRRASATTPLQLRLTTVNETTGARSLGQIVLDTVL